MELLGICVPGWDPCLLESPIFLLGGPEVWGGAGAGPVVGTVCSLDITTG
jgi:hypothetical protein